jgi:imidazolonepropionase-like amidohydrolase
VLAGTDAGTPFNPPGMLVSEMQLLADLGLGAAGAIRGATSLAADTLGLDDLGVVAVGKRADLVLVAGDPLVDLTVLRSPRAVAQDGKIRVVL